MSNENCRKSDVCGQEQTYQLDQSERSEPATVLISQTMCRHWISRSNLPDIGIRTSRSPPTKDSRYFLDTCVLCSSIHLEKFCFAGVYVVNKGCSEQLFSPSVITRIWVCIVGIIIRWGPGCRGPTDHFNYCSYFNQKFVINPLIVFIRSKCTEHLEKKGINKKICPLIKTSL